MYIIQATVNGRQIPTFFLDENIQGIVDEETCRDVAMDILNPLKSPDLEIHMFATIVY